MFAISYRCLTCQRPTQFSAKHFDKRTVMWWTDLQKVLRLHEVVLKAVRGVMAAWNILKQAAICQGLRGWSGPRLGKSEALPEHCHAPQRGWLGMRQLEATWGNSIWTIWTATATWGSVTAVTQSNVSTVQIMSTSCAWSPCPCSTLDFSRMRSGGFLFNFGGLRVQVCPLAVALPTATVRNRSPPFATVRNRSQPFATVRSEGRNLRTLGDCCKRVTLGGLKGRVTSF